MLVSHPHGDQEAHVPPKPLVSHPHSNQTCIVPPTRSYVLSGEDGALKNPFFASMLFGDNFAYLEVFFDLNEAQHMESLQSSTAALQESLLTGQLKSHVLSLTRDTRILTSIFSVRKIFTIVISHATPSGDMHFAPNNAASTWAHEIMNYLMPPGLLKAFNGCGRQSNNHILVFLTCGAICTVKESCAALNKWMRSSNSFYALIGFEAAKFHPTTACGFLEAALQEYFYHCDQSFFENCLPSGGGLGSCSAVVYLRGNGKSPRRYMWHHPARAPFGVPVPVSCSRCHSVCSLVLSKYNQKDRREAGGSRAVSVQEPRLALECNLCGDVSRHIKPDDLQFTSKLDEGGIWVYRPLEL
ncbi:hypothetical protein C8R46DRAFT_1029315 [Mycena filopes]|nr:hypothetical protein C8R46DRAFT_1029315 [Mycena filopes]